MLRTRWGAPLIKRTAFAVIIGTFAGSLAMPASSFANQETWFSGFSSIVVDAKTGEVLDSSKGDELRHPASLTKIMTLYLLFAELEAGRLKLDSKIKMSSDAANQPPSKLGLQAGQTIEVEDAIKAVVTRSANDIAVAIAEVISGDEDSFARMMTSRARSLGMTKTVFKNASGLPDAGQVTTARDMALLGLAIQDRFPKYYPYFATRSFHWRGVAIGNHNRLLGSVDGVDGIKTGYTRASGFNLVSSVKRGNRQIVAVVLGGKSGAARDAQMRDLISEKIRFAHAGPRLAPRFAENSVPMPQPSPVANAAARPAQPEPGSGEPVERRPVRVVAVARSGEVIAEGDRPAGTLGTLTISAMSTPNLQKPAPAAPTGIAPDGKIVTFAPPPTPTEFASASAQTSPEIGRTYAVTTPVQKPESAASAALMEREITSAASTTSALPGASPRGGWIVQIGAFPNESTARERLAEAQARALAELGQVNAYTEKTSKGSSELYRARFAGFDETSAKRACERLKKNDFSCFAARN